VFAPGSWSDVEKLALLIQYNAVPHAARYDNGLTRMERKHPLRSSLFEDNRDVPGDEEQHFVAIGMHLAAVGRVSRHDGRPHGEPVHAGGDRARSG